MSLFAPDLYRNFAIGFLGAGALIVGTTFDGSGLTAEAVASEKTRPVAADIPVADEFVITGEAQQSE